MKAISKYMVKLLFAERQIRICTRLPTRHFVPRSVADVVNADASGRVTIETWGQAQAC